MANKPSLAETHPEIAKQWHPTKNDDLTASDVTKGSHKKIWWKCKKGEDHEWEMEIASRTSQSQGCKVCAGYIVVKSNCLSTLNPEVAKEWHPTKNKKLTPYDVSVGSSKKVWWKCDKGDDHEWITSIKDRRRHNCPICSGRKAVKSNCLATVNTEITKQWHPTKNKNLTPNMFVAGSHKKVWWKCDKGNDHEWIAAIGDRNFGNGCPICKGLKIVKSNCLSTLNSELAKEWHPTKNGKITPYDVGVGSSKKVWWKCDKGDDHEWLAPVGRRNNGAGCPVCTCQIIVKSNCLATLNPEVAKEWHPTKNGKITPYDVNVGSNKNAWWKCDKGDDHEWKVRIVARKDNGCPCCSGRKLALSNSLSYLYPNIASLWHPHKNKYLRPDNLIANSHKKVWWKYANSK